MPSPTDKPNGGLGLEVSANNRVELEAVEVSGGGVESGKGWDGEVGEDDMVGSLNANPPRIRNRYMYVLN